MRFQFWFLLEPSAAEIAGIRPLDWVDFLMNVQYGLLVEALLAYVTGERPLARVNPLVDFQDRCLVESFTTGVATIRLHARVDDLVPHQPGSIRKRFSTVFTHKLAYFPLVSVNRSLERDGTMFTDSVMSPLQSCLHASGYYRTAMISFILPFAYILRISRDKLIISIAFCYTFNRHRVCGLLIRRIWQDNIVTLITGNTWKKSFNFLFQLNFSFLKTGEDFFMALWNLLSIFLFRNRLPVLSCLELQLRWNVLHVNEILWELWRENEYKTDDREKKLRICLSPKH